MILGTTNSPSLVAGITEINTAPAPERGAFAHCFDK